MKADALQERANCLGGVVDCAREEGEDACGLVEDRGDQSRTESTDGGVHVLQRAGGAVAHLLGCATDVGRDDLLEGGSVDLAVRDHLRQLLAADLVLILQPLEDRETTVRELLQLSGHGLAVGRDLVEDRGHLFERRARDGGSVGDAREVLGQLLAGLDASGNGSRGSCRSFVQAEGGALHGGSGRVHDLRDGLGIVAQADQLGLGVIDSRESCDALGDGVADTASDCATDGKGRNLE
ncbi:hypothetical protein [Mycolicibacterium sp. CBMA 361]|uniref:hypothetical protein n=1 Tax=Mycolicibacterium sp. CBMA 361 TaxID=2606610 RepID=UPI001EEFF7BA|nr:hypothetical protein [Mycolicibacterium sp. CBMA 361]